MNWKVKLEKRVRITQKSRYHFNNKKLSKIYIITKALFLLNKNKGWGIVRIWGWGKTESKVQKT